MCEEDGLYRVGSIELKGKLNGKAVQKILAALAQTPATVGERDTFGLLHFPVSSTFYSFTRLGDRRLLPTTQNTSTRESTGLFEIGSLTAQVVRSARAGTYPDPRDRTHRLQYAPLHGSFASTGVALKGSLIDVDSSFGEELDVFNTAADEALLVRLRASGLAVPDRVRVFGHATVTASDILQVEPSVTVAIPLYEGDD